ncbi:Bardet-Biedl syndrome 12 protein isoform X1 [Chiloscyllium plagiosum]|uniref:Bardet-Biedl syndrome 12 protein isoform X1 n=1 Tax=Chiloscyllium plagiosum TaxID=36176 RepID=UPI001CB7EECC|nr:Bardet-Biedl syndrome 12 protein isoform X1 [Chiloscyllium plagiosum]
MKQQPLKTEMRRNVFSQRVSVGIQCSLLNQKSHLGLEQISAVAASGSSLLGSKKYKFIVDDETSETIVICSAFRLLENLQLDCPVGQLLNEAIQAHHKQYKSGTSTLLFLAGAWSKAVLNCINQGIPIPIIVSEMYGGLEHCFEILISRQISIDSILENSQCKQRSQTIKADRLSCTLTSFPTHPTNEMQSVVKEHAHFQSNISIKMNSRNHYSISNEHGSSMLSFSSNIITHASSDQGHPSYTRNQAKARINMSRHFVNSNINRQEEALPDLSNSFQQDSFSTPADSTRFTALALSLSHGNHRMMKLAIEAYKIQTQSILQETIKKRPLPEFNIDKLVTYFLPGPPEHESCVSPGFVTLISEDQSEIVQDLATLPLHTIFISGDLTDKYRHPGFNRISDIKVVTQTVEDISKTLEEEWLCRTMDILHKFHINLILVKGLTSPYLMNKCLQEKILVIQEVKEPVFQRLTKAMEGIHVTYITQVKENCVGTGAHLCLWKMGHGNIPNLGERFAVQINTYTTAVITVVLCSPLRCKLQTLVDQFWTCAYRLKHALSERRIFPGAGATELACLCHLKQQILKNSPCTLGINETSCIGTHRSSWFAETAVLFKSQVLQALADGLTEYLVTAMFNTGMYETPLDALSEVQKCLHDSNGTFPIISELSEQHVKVGIPCRSSCSSLSDDCFDYEVYDNVTIKIEAWRRALNLVLLVLRADAEIITGTKAKAYTVSEDQLREGTFL